MSGNAGAQNKTPGYAWVILLIVYLLSVAAAMLWFSCPPMANNIIETYIIGPAVGAAMAASGGAADAGQVIAGLNINADFGMLMTWIAIGTIVSSVVAIFAQNKLGIKWILVIAAAFLVAGGVMSAMSGSDYNMLSAARFVIGLGIGFVALSATTAISMWFADDHRAFAIALWATWVPVSVLVEYNIIVPLATSAGDFHNTWWVVTAIAIIALVLCLFAYRMPPATGQISTEKSSLRDGMKFIKKRQVIFLMLCMFFYNFVSHGFTTFNPSFFTDAVEAGGMGWNDEFANLIASIATASGIIAPIFGFIYDRIPFKSKYIMVIVGAVGYVLACVFGFKNLGMAVFGVYMVFMILANGIMVATLRSMMPMLVGRGGVTAVTLGLAFFTILEFGGQLFTNFYGLAMDMLGYAGASLAVGVPVACLLVFSAFMIKPDAELIEANAHAPQGH